EDWLARLRAFPAYMQQTIALMREGIGRRMLLPKVVMERVPPQIHRQIVDDPEKSLFFKPFKRFPDEITPSQQQELAAAAKQAIAEEIVPAYRTFAAFF